MASLDEGLPAERPSPGRRRVGRVSALDRDDGSRVSLHDQLAHLGSEVQPAAASRTLSAADSTRRQIEYLHADGIDLAVERLVGTMEEPEV